MCITSSLCVLGHVCMCVWICICYKLQNFWVQGFVLCFLQIALSVDWTSRQSIHVHEWLVVSHPSPSQPPSGLAWPGMELSGFPGPLSYWVMNEWDGLCPVIGAPGTVGAFCVTSVCRTRRQIFRNAWDEEEFAPSLSQEGSMFLWLGIKQTAAFLFSPQIICPNKRQLSWGEKYSFSSALPLCMPLLTACSLTVCISTVQCQVSSWQQGRVCCPATWKPLWSLLTQRNIRAKGQFPRMAPSLSRIPKDFLSL